MTDCAVVIERKRYNVIDGIWHPDHIRETRIMPAAAAENMKAEYPGSVISIKPVDNVVGFSRRERTEHKSRPDVVRRPYYTKRTGTRVVVEPTGPLDYGTLINKEMS